MSKDAYYFSHDSNARHDLKIVSMMEEYGAEGYGWYWILIEILREQERYELKLKQYVINAVAKQMHCDSNAAKSFIEKCINTYELFASNDELFWSESLKRRMKEKDEKKEQARKAAAKRWGKSEDDANAKRTDSGRNAGAMPRKKKKEEEKKYKYIEFVYLTNEQHAKLIDKFGENKTGQLIERLNDYIGSKGKKYKSHYHTILTWERNDNSKHNPDDDDDPIYRKALKNTAMLDKMKEEERLANRK